MDPLNPMLVYPHELTQTIHSLAVQKMAIEEAIAVKVRIHILCFVHIPGLGQCFQVNRP